MKGVLSIGVVFTFLFLIIIGILHIAALITSFYCFKHGVNLESIFGFIIFFFLGPFFWFYFAFAKNYCKDLYNINPIVANNQPIQQ
mgnify:CR=1 FL=1|tara:strand:+ start:4670 stop:4927 length:258 start_codon:yes stop_codon:yes gene_type:complete